MSAARALLKTITSGMLAVLLALVPFSGGRNVKSEEPVLLKVALVSDVHIDRRLPVGQAALVNAYREMGKFHPDAIAVLGDLTNYGDAATMDRFFAITKKYVPDGVTPIVISGNHDIGHAEVSNEEARQIFTDQCNRTLQYGIDRPFYTIEVNGHSFICMNDESEDNWDRPEYSDAQLRFLNSALKTATKDGKPAFVLCHVPLTGIHGEEHFYPAGGTEEPWNTAVRRILERYDNVFFLSGHIHKGLSNDVHYPTYTEKNGVHYLSLPSYLMPNFPMEFSINGIGFLMEVTASRVTFRCRNYYAKTWYTSYDYSTALDTPEKS